MNSKISTMLADILEFVKDWNFLGPLALWAGAIGLSRYRIRRRRTGIWSLRQARPVTLVIDQPVGRHDHVDGEIGSLSIARAAQRLADEFVAIGLKATVVEIGDLRDDPAPGHLVFLGRIQDDRSRLLTELQRLGRDATFRENVLKVSPFECRAKYEIRHGNLTLISDEVVIAKGSRAGSEGALVVLAGTTAAGVEAAVRCLTQPDNRVLRKPLARIGLAQMKVDIVLGKMDSVHTVQ